MEVKFFSVGCGDAISIRFLGSDRVFHNILIDGGEERNENNYKNGIKKEIDAIIKRKEIIDLWIITHIDDDHIGGILRFIYENNTTKQVDISKTIFWYNYANEDYDTRITKSDYKNVPQAILLRDYLKSHSKLEESITTATEPIDFYGAKITILSPNQQRFEALVEKWKNEEMKEDVKRKVEEKKRKMNIPKYQSAKSYDYDTKVDDFDLTQFEEDKKPENGSSIAFIFEYSGKCFLFLADSFPSVIVESLTNLGFTEENKLILDVMQVAHHGSKGNTSNELLKLISFKEDAKFVISANSINVHKLPNKETMSRIIRHFPEQKVQFYITHKNEKTLDIIKKKDNLKNVEILFSEGFNPIEL